MNGECECTKGYYEDADICHRCIAPCEECTGADACTKCQGDHKLENGKCKLENGQEQNEGLKLR